jgi:DNA-binding FadR family transcriptional regulator
MERHQTALSQLRRMIGDGAVGEDGRLPPERSLAGELGVGRRSLRRALEVLEEEGQIWRRQGQGTFVSLAKAPSDIHLGRISEHTNPMEIMEVRLAIEPPLARLAAVRASRCDLERLVRLAEETRAAPNAEDYEKANAAFHRRIAEAARNALYLTLLDAVNDILRDLACERLGESAHCFKRQAVYAGFHAEIVEAISARDGERAEKIMYAHLRDVQQNILARAFPAVHDAEPG